MNITITIPDKIVTKVINGFCAARGYNEDSKTPLTKEQFISLELTKYLTSTAVSGQGVIASSMAARAMIGEIQADPITIADLSSLDNKTKP